MKLPIPFGQVIIVQKADNMKVKVILNILTSISLSIG